MRAELEEEEWVRLAQAAQLGGNVLQMVLGINARPILPVLEKLDAQLRAQKFQSAQPGNGQSQQDEHSSLHQ
jgi:hypothetical protein